MRKILLLMVASIQLGQIGGALAEAWRPRPRITRSRWCEEHLRLPAAFAAQPGSFSFQGREYQPEILDAVDDPSVREIVSVMAPQVGKTELLRAICASQGEVDAAPMMFAGPDQLYAREQREQIYAMCEATPALRRRVPDERHRNDRWIDLERSRIFLAWSGSTQRLSGRSCKVVLASEGDRWQRSLELAEKRTRAFWNHTFCVEGSPIKASAQLWPRYQRTDRRRYHVPCPHCDHFQELRFFPHRDGPHAGKGGVAGLKRENGSWKKPEEGRCDAYYVCESCGERIESQQKAEMVRRGVWCPEGCQVKDGKLCGKSTNPGRRRGYQLSALYAPTVTFGDAAEAYLALRDTTDGLETFFNDWLGLPFKARGKTPRWKDLARKISGTHLRGKIPQAAYFLTGAADVQEDRVYWAVRAWGDRCTSWLIDWGCCRRDRQEAEPIFGSDLAKLGAALIDRRWHVLGENPRGLSALAACRIGIDSGYRPTEVYEFVRSHPGGRVLAVAGDPKIVPGTFYRHQTLEKNVRTKKAYPEGTSRWGIDTGVYKGDIQDRWNLDPKAPGAWLVPADILEHPDGEDYLRQISNERRVQEAVRGKKTTLWEVINDADGNHQGDVEVYLRALADMVVGQIWNATQWQWGTAMKPEPQETDHVQARDGAGEDFSAR